MKQTGFAASVRKSFSQAAHYVARHALPLFSVLSRTSSGYIHRATNEAHILYDGVLHAGEVAPDDLVKIRRNAVGVGVETALSVAEGIEFEVTALVAVAEAGEKVTNHGKQAMNGRDWFNLAAETCESLLSSPAAALHCAHDLFHDLDHAGRLYEAAHLPV